MAKDPGFLKYKRHNPAKVAPADRIRNFKEFEIPLNESGLANQAMRCMDCGIPFCHAAGCPLVNHIPDWNSMVYHAHWQKALALLHATNNFPEFTGRICPAPCEYACTLAIHDSPVTIRHIELQIVEKGWHQGWIKPQIIPNKTGKKIAVIGSGPSGLAAAQQLIRAGHAVVVFEKRDRIGGLLRYGVPDFKLDKAVIDRRLAQMEAEGVVFEPGVDVGRDISPRYLKRTYDAIVIATGTTVARDLTIPGRQLAGIHLAMDYLIQQNQINAGYVIPPEQIITAKDKDVIVLGGGDTGSDCVGTAHRQGAKSIAQVEILPQPPGSRTLYNAWPAWPQILMTSSSHEEGCERLFGLSAKSFEGTDNVRQVTFARLKWTEPDKNGARTSREIAGSQFCLKADLVLLALGFLHAEHGNLVHELGIVTNARGNIVVDQHYVTSEAKFFATGDAVSGASLIVKA
ncbi:MAG: glutamate synthase subunit beta, partial [Candidatus Neomarinimicrobiota bacterium]